MDHTGSLDSEGLILQTCERYRKFVAVECFEPHSMNDKEGKDMHIVFPHNGINFDLQVSTSDNDETLGIYLPISNPPPKKLAPLLTPQMLSKTYRHQRRYPSVPFLLFVARYRNTPAFFETIYGDIWRQLFGLYAHAFAREFNALHSYRQTAA